MRRTRRAFIPFIHAVTCMHAFALHAYMHACMHVCMYACDANA